MKALRTLSANQNRRSFLKQAAIFFFCVNALTFPVFADEREDLTAALRKAFPEYRSDKMDIAEITRLLDAGADPNGIYNPRIEETFLIRAADIKNVELVRLLLEYGADPNAVRSYEYSAAFSGNGEITALLISYRARFDVMNERWVSPLLSHADNHSIPSATLILEWEQTHSPDFSASFETRKKYLTEVLYEILSGDSRYYDDDGKVNNEKTYTFTERLLDAGADPAAPSKEGRIPTAYWAVGKKELQFLVPLLVERGAPIDALNVSGKTALYCTVETNNLELANFLLKRGADPNQQCTSGETALMAVRSKEAVDLLISSGANPNLQDKDGETVLMETRKLEQAFALLQAGADPTIKNKRGQTVLHIWDYELIEPLFDDLISRGCKIDEPDNSERTPLIYNAYFAFSLSSYRDKLFLLLEKGADPNLQDKSGRTALHEYLLRIEKEHISSTKLTEWNKSVITTLLEAGTNPAIKDNKGDSALITAIRISKKNKNLAALRDIVQKYASKEDIKVASADLRKTVSTERRKSASENIPYTMKALIFPVALGGLSYFMREVAYKDNPSANFMGGLNAGLTLGGGGFLLGAMIGASTAHNTGSWSDMYSGIFEGLIGGVLGGTIGIVIACQPSVSNAFKNNSLFYYTPTAISGIIATVYILRLWF